MARNTKSARAKTTKSATSRRSAPSLGVKEEATLLHELFVDELKDIYWAEKHLVKALPKLRKAATSQELANALEDHLEVTQNQIDRLDEVFEMIDMTPRAKKCEAMEGLVKEAMILMEGIPKGTAARDAGLIISTQKIEHYEIASYGSMVQLARTMGRDDVADLLDITLEEEKETDLMLTELAVSGINITAEEETEEDEE
jgi:ferritin-like metal-binding protein YciE